MKNTVPTSNGLQPIVYACSGCSSAGQMANALALRMDREGLAEMSCIAGVGGNVPAIVRKAQSERSLLAIDGCPLQCALASLRQRGLEPQGHVDLSRLGVSKAAHVDFSPGQAAALFVPVVERLGLAAPAVVP